MHRIFRGFCGLHYFILLIVFLVVGIDVIGFMKLVKSKDFVVFQPCRRVEVGSNGTVNEISEDFSAMGIGV